MSADFAPGARVRIMTGAAGGRTGTVVSAYQGLNGLVVNVEHERPVLLTAPDGPSQVVRLPYAPGELEVLEPEPTPALAAEQVADSAVAELYARVASLFPGLEREARGTAARSVALHRSEGLHGRAALAATAESLLRSVRFLREDDSDVRRWERALQLVQDRLQRLDRGRAATSGGAR